jgi:hypothetical protein
MVRSGVPRPSGEHVFAKRDSMLLNRPVDAAGMIYWHGGDRFPVGSELDVPADQCAIFVRDGVVLGMVLAGRHRLVTEAVPFLGHALAHTPEGPMLFARVCFAPIEPYPGVEVSARLGQVNGPSAPSFAIKMRTLVTLRVDDPFRLGAFLATMPHDRTLESVVAAQLAPRLAALVSGMASEGEVPIGTVGGAALGAVKEALHAGSLSIEELGIQVADVTALELRPDAPSRRPEAPAPDALRWGLQGIAFRDGPTGRGVYVKAYGTFDGDPIPEHLHEWVRNLIVHAIRTSAESYTGSVQDLPARSAEWSDWLTQAVSPNVEQQLGARGRVTILGVEVLPG